MMSSNKSEGVVIQSKSTKYQLNFMLMYIITIYIPYLVLLLTSKYNIFNTSISSIAWKMDGLPFIILYGTLTIPFLLYEAYFFMRFNKKDKDALAGPLLAGCIMLGLGIVFPCRGSGFSTNMHCLFSQLGAIIMAVAITGVVRRYLRKQKGEGKRVNNKIALPYGAFLIIATAILLLKGTPAIWEVGSSLIFMSVFYLVNMLSVAAFCRPRLSENRTRISRLHNPL